MARYSYSTMNRTIAGRLHEARALIRRALQPPDLGPGQLMGCLRCFSLDNEMFANDTDVIGGWPSTATLVEMLRYNSFERVVVYSHSVFEHRRLSASSPK